MLFPLGIIAVDEDTGWDNYTQEIAMRNVVFLYSHSYPSLSDMSQKGIFLARRLNENAECLISMRQGRKDENPHASGVTDKKSKWEKGEGRLVRCSAFERD